MDHLAILVEYDDGKPIELKGKAKDERIPECTPRGRARGFYACFPDGTERRIPIGYMRVSEMKALADLFNAAPRNR